MSAKGYDQSKCNIHIIFQNKSNQQHLQRAKNLQRKVVLLPTQQKKRMKKVGTKSCFVIKCGQQRIA
jgi:hypothetical protein